jgi:cytochrome b561
MQDTQVTIPFPPEVLVPARPERFDATSMMLHWVTVVLVACQFVTALLHDQFAGGAAVMLVLHRSTGVLTWLVVVMRLAWRRWFAYLPPCLVSMPRLQQWAAKLNEYGLYLLLLLQPLTGLGNTLLRGRPFGLFFWEVPALLDANKALAHQVAEIHETSAWILLALIGLHVGAATFHALVLRDRVLQRMLPG